MTNIDQAPRSETTWPISASRHCLVLAAAWLIGMGVATGGSHAKALSPQEIAAQRQDILNKMLTEHSYEEVATQRWNCAMGQEPATVAESRAGGAYFFPDAADSCVTTLIRVARDGQLPDFYARLTSKLGGSAAASTSLPNAIGTSVTHNGTQVAIGNGKAAVVTPALAFDAGFTVAYQSQATNREAADARQLKVLTEACLAQQQDVGTCFSAGYLSGARSFSLRTAAAH